MASVNHLCSADSAGTDWVQMRCQRKWRSVSLYLTCHLWGLLAGSQLFITASTAQATTDCDSILSDTISWDADNDLVDQRNALIEFYNATGGEYWTSYVLTSSLRSTINGFDEYLVELGEITSASLHVLTHLLCTSITLLMCKEGPHA